MKTKHIKLLLLVSFLLTLLLPVQSVLADTGPKPTMEFQFKGLQDGELQIVSGILYECEWSDCRDAAPLQELGPQRLTCDATGCHAIAYGFAPYHTLQVEFSDGTTRRSNVFKTGGFNSKYTVTVQPDDLLVEEKFSLGIFGSFSLILACICVLSVGLIAGLILFFVRRSRKS